jgi:hypothetical protein
MVYTRPLDEAHYAFLEVLENRTFFGIDSMRRRD